MAQDALPGRLSDMLVTREPRLMNWVAIVIFLIGAVLGTVLRFRLFLRASLLIAAGIALLGLFRAQGLYSILMTFLTAVLFVILMLAGAAIGRTLKQAFLEG